jgi:hypothetical protein
MFSSAAVHGKGQLPNSRELWKRDSERVQHPQYDPVIALEPQK